VLQGHVDGRSHDHRGRLGDRDVADLTVHADCHGLQGGPGACQVFYGHEGSLLISYGCRTNFLWSQQKPFNSVDMFGHSNSISVLRNIELFGDVLSTALSFERSFR
jgi:hypothetical protein